MILGRSGRSSQQASGGGRGGQRHGRGFGLATEENSSNRVSQTVLSSTINSMQRGGRTPGGPQGRGRGGRGRSQQGAGQKPSNTAAERDEPPRPPPAWKSSTAKDKLQRLLQDETSYVHSGTSTIEAIHGGDPMFAVYPLKNFKTNFRNLKNTIQSTKSAVRFDQLSLEKEKEMFPRNALTARGYPFWDTHPCRTLLETDLKQGRIDNMTPFQVWNSNDQYKAFPLKVFRNNLNRMKRSEKEAVYWQVKRNRKGQKEHERVIAAQQEGGGATPVATDEMINEAVVIAEEGTFVKSNQ